MIRWMVWGAAVLVSLGFIVYGVFNLLDREQITYQDETGKLNEFAVKVYAEALRERGARVAIYMLPTGNAEDLTRRLNAEALLIEGKNRPDLVAIYATQDFSFTAVYIGDIWRTPLGMSAEEVRVNFLNPPLQEGEYTRAFVETLTLIYASLPEDYGEERNTFSFWITALAGVVALGLLAWYYRADHITPRQAG
jgi:hypothetical protein